MAVRTAGQLGGLIDEGRDNYGTLFGTAISMFGTGFGSNSTRGVVTLGPVTSLASGKVTLWAQPGLYGVTTDAVSSSNGPDEETAINIALHADGTPVGRLTTDTNDSQVAINVGAQRDRSLVSTTASTAGEKAAYDHQVIWLLGNSQA